MEGEGILLERQRLGLRKEGLSPFRLGCSEVMLLSGFLRFALVPLRYETRTDSNRFGSIVGVGSLSISNDRGKGKLDSFGCLS